MTLFATPNQRSWKSTQSYAHRALEFRPGSNGGQFRRPGLQQIPNDTGQKSAVPKNADLIIRDWRPQCSDLKRLPKLPLAPGFNPAVR